MTADDTDRWRELFGQVVVMCDKTWDEAQSKFYFDGLKEFPFADVRSGVLAVMYTHRFPKVPMLGELRAAIYKQRWDAKRDRSMVLATRRLTAEVHCAACRDTGMRTSTADPDRLAHCECRDTNENYQISRARLRMADEQEDTPTIPNDEAAKINSTVRDFKRLSSGE